MASHSLAADGPVQISGIYPHLAYWNPDRECGTGAVVPWAGKLWVITYAPHSPKGSADKLYSITPDLRIEPFEGSVGGTPANRMIHRETNQLIIGPYVIDAKGCIRVIPPEAMYGRLTGSARHLFQPEKKAYYATMEEGLYEVDLETLQVTELYRDTQKQIPAVLPNDTGSKGPLANLPGCHGKGLYSGQGRLIYANNGESSREARQYPDVLSGCLAEWDGTSRTWKVIRRNQFTDVRGPGGLYGNSNHETDPVWAIGWDRRSLLLMLLDNGAWSTYRFPKASHTYDGAHGWNTEWPRIHDIGENDFIMNMHGMFWRFPKTFSRTNSAGLLPRSTYLKVIGDYCRWGDRLVFGCDDTAQSEFLNTRRAKGKIAAPGKSHSNLWFTSPSIVDSLGVPLGRGAVWIDEAVLKDTPSDPYLFSGFERRGVWMKHSANEAVTFSFEVDVQGNGEWQLFRQYVVVPGDGIWAMFDPGDLGVWLRVSVDHDCRQATVQFHYVNSDPRTIQPDTIFGGMATTQAASLSGGLLHVRGGGRETLGFAASRVIDGRVSEPQFYELDGKMQLKLVDDSDSLQQTLADVAIPTDILIVDTASVLYIDDDGNRWRLPKGDCAFDRDGILGPERIAREVVTERDLFNCHGTFYELPARNAGGFAKIRPICSHQRRIKDFCSYRGLLILSGVDANAPMDNEHIIHSDDGKVALWAGAVDDLWKFGKPVGTGGPWKDTFVQANRPSDPYLMTGYDQKILHLATAFPSPMTVHAEVDITGSGHWLRYRSFTISADRPICYEFPRAFQAYWIRLISAKDAVVTGWLEYQ
ncbi:MAG: hypothetical protein JW829_11010 [Pirellulales bacterium]|nr:hypothetical protein [Pirellulales bacterium]